MALEVSQGVGIGDRLSPRRQPSAFPEAIHNARAISTDTHTFIQTEIDRHIYVSTEIHRSGTKRNAQEFYKVFACSGGNSFLET